MRTNKSNGFIHNLIIHYIVESIKHLKHSHHLEGLKGTLNFDSPGGQTSCLNLDTSALCLDKYRLDLSLHFLSNRTVSGGGLGAVSLYLQHDGEGPAAFLWQLKLYGMCNLIAIISKFEILHTGALSSCIQRSVASTKQPGGLAVCLASG